MEETAAANAAADGGGCGGSGGDDGEDGMGDNKPPLSHTHSLPTPKKGGQRSSSADGAGAAPGAGPRAGSTGSESGTPPPNANKQSKLGQPKHVGRSQSVRTKSSSNKVWNLGSMAKAVGSGMTAFGSNVVSGSKAVGSEVYHGTVVVGTNVVEGTKAAGRVTKDVTLAAGKGVAHAGEKMADTTVQAGKMVASASISAVQDTVDKTTLLIEEGIDNLDPTNILDAEEEGKHLVLPGEDLAQLSAEYGTTPEALIRRNRLTSRRLRPGTRVDIPKKGEKAAPAGAGRHPMEKVQLKDALLLGQDDGREEERRDFCSVTFAPERITVGARTFPIATGVAELRVELQHEERMPDLLPPESLDHHGGGEHVGGGRCGGGGGGGGRGVRASSVVGLGANSSYVVLTIVLSSSSSEEEEEEEEKVDEEEEDVQESEKEVRLRFSAAFGEAMVAHARLWFPDLLNAESVSKYEMAVAEMQEEEEDGGGGNDGESAMYACNSYILKRTSLLASLHHALPQQTRSQRWNRVYLSILDGYSLQNFYRKVACFQEPFLIVIQDTDDEVFGAFLTNVPCVTEEFIGTGESFLFKVVDERVAGGGGGGGGGGVDDVVVRVSPWNRGPDGNQHFFQGKPGCLVVGASQGRFGLWVDGNLDHGRLDRCLTFEKWPPPAPALQPKDFKVKCLECYNFV